MGLSGDEIVKIAQECAQQVLEGLFRYSVEYKEPQHIEDGLRDSMIEEKTAAAWYRKRGTDALLKGDKKTADLYGHIAREEDAHYQEFQERLVLLTNQDNASNPGSPGTSEIEKLKEYKGKAYRVDIENWGIPRDATVADIIRFEKKELGNVYPVSGALMKELDQYGYRNAVWVTKEKEVAAEYLSEGMTEADISEIDLGEGAKIVTEDGLGGYLVLYGEARPKPLSVKI